MDIDTIIESLNKRIDFSHGIINKSRLTGTEKIFMKKYKPENKLIIYGTLAPGRPNHSVVEHIKGTWKEGIVRGILEKKGWGADLGYYGFRPVGAEKQEAIKAFILVSAVLMDNWQMLDEFEGEEYKRILAKYELEDGEIGVGCIYAINEK